MTDHPLRVLVLDGADHRVLDGMMASGRLPVLNRLRERGVHARADTVGGLFEEAVWPEIFTGEPLGDHATQHFTRFDHSDHGLLLEREPHALVPFWEHLPGRGRGVLAVDIPQLHPDPASPADHVCSWGTWAAPHGPHPQRDPVTRELGDLRPEMMSEFDHEPTIDDERRFSAAMAANARRRMALATGPATRRPVACIGVHELHGTAHVLGHHWLDDHPHHPWPPEPELVTSVYEVVDRAIEPFVADPDSNVVVLASQGFTPANSSNPVLDELFVRAGLAVPPGGSDPGTDDTTGQGRSLDPMALLRRWLSPELRERLAVRLLPESWQQRLMADKFRSSLDWSRTRAFPVPSWSVGYIRVNLAGRERHGIVRTEDYDDLLDEVASLVSGLVVAGTGQPMVARVHRMRERFPGRRADELPDLAVEWATDRPVRRVSHPVLGEWSADSDYHRFRWCDHHGHAVAFLAGPSIAPGDEPVDVPISGAAATFLRLAGARAPSTMAPAWDHLLR